jgi:hypothetical protein
MFHLMRFFDGRWLYVETADSSEQALRCARDAERFYGNHGVKVTHAIGVQRGQAIEFTPIH